MADELIKRKDLLRQIDKVSCDDWIRAAKECGFLVTQRKGGSSHYRIGIRGFPSEDFKGYIMVIYEHIHKQDKPKVFKKFMREGIEEDRLWKLLGLLK